MTDTTDFDQPNLSRPDPRRSYLVTTIDGDRLPGSIHGLPGATLDRLDELARITARSPSELVALAISKYAPPVEHSAAPGAAREREAINQPPAPDIAHVYTDPDGDTLALVAQSYGPADWLLRLTTAAGDGELDLWVEDDETLAGIARGWLGAIEDRPR